MLVQKSVILLVNCKTLFDLKLSLTDRGYLFVISFLANSLILLINNVFNRWIFGWKLNIYNRTILWAENSKNMINTQISGNLTNYDSPIVEMFTFYIFCNFDFQKAVTYPFLTQFALCQVCLSFTSQCNKNICYSIRFTWGLNCLNKLNLLDIEVFMYFIF